MFWYQDKSTTKYPSVYFSEFSMNSDYWEVWMNNEYPIKFFLSKNRVTFVRKIMLHFGQLKKYLNRTSPYVRTLWNKEYRREIIKARYRSHSELISSLLCTFLSSNFQDFQISRIVYQGPIANLENLSDYFVGVCEGKICDRTYAKNFRTWLTIQTTLANFEQYVSRN